MKRVTLKLTINGTEISLGTRDCYRLLAATSADGDDCSSTCKQIREDLGRALTRSDTAPASPALRTLYDLLRDKSFKPTVV